MSGVSVEVDIYRGERPVGSPADSSRLTSDATGAFSVRLPGAGAWTVELSPRHAGFVGKRQTVSVHAERAPPPTLLSLHALDGQRVVRVTDSDARPLEGVRLTDELSPNVLRTDAQGLLTLPVSSTMPPTARVLSHPGHVTTVRAIGSWAGVGPQELEVVLPTGFAIQGTIRDTGGRPVEGADLRLVDRAGTRSSSDRRGAFRLDGLSPSRANQLMICRHRDYLPMNVRVTPENANLPLDIVMKRGIDVRGTVIGPRGEPMVGATVTLGDNPHVGRSLQVTDANGAFCVGAPLGARITLLASYPGLAPTLRDLEIRPPLSPLELRLKQGKILRGSLVDETGTPIKAALVNFYVERRGDLGRRCLSDEAGHWEMAGLPDTPLNLEVFKYGFVPVAEEGVRPGEGELVRTMQRSGGFTGQVMDQHSRPVTRFHVALTPSINHGQHAAAVAPTSWSLPGRLFEDGEGRFGSDRTSLMSGRAYRIEVSANGYQTHSIDPYIPTVDPRNESLSVTLKPGGEVSGRSLGPDGRPLAGVVVAPVGAFPFDAATVEQGPRATTAADGSFTLRGLPAGAAAIEFRRRGFMPATRSPRVDPARPNRMADVNLRPAGSLTVQIRTTRSSALGQTTLVLEATDTGARDEHVMTEPRLTLPWVNAGPYRVSLRSSRAELDGLSTSVEIRAGHRRPIAFEPTIPTYEIRGRVTVDGQPPESLKVTLVLSRRDAADNLARQATQVTTGDGAFAFMCLAPGRWHIGASFDRDGRRHSGSLEVDLNAATAPVRIDLRTR